MQLVDDYGFGFDDGEFCEFVGLSWQTAFSSSSGVTFLPTGHFGNLFYELHLSTYKWTFHLLKIITNFPPTCYRTQVSCLTLPGHIIEVGGHINTAGEYVVTNLTGPPGGQIRNQWCHRLAKVPTNASDAPWWPNL